MFFFLKTYFLRKPENLSVDFFFFQSKKSTLKKLTLPSKKKIDTGECRFFFSKSVSIFSDDFFFKVSVDFQCRFFSQSQCRFFFQSSVSIFYKSIEGCAKRLKIVQIKHMVAPNKTTNFIFRKKCFFLLQKLIFMFIFTIKYWKIFQKGNCGYFQISKRSWDYYLSRVSYMSTFFCRGCCRKKNWGKSFIWIWF